MDKDSRDKESYRKSEPVINDKLGDVDKIFETHQASDRSTADVPQSVPEKNYVDFKSRLKISEVFSLCALLVSIYAVMLNQCSLRNSRKSVEIAESALAESIRKDSLLKIQFELTNQPFLQISSIELEPVVVNKPIRIHFKLENTTNIPAQLVSHSSSLYIVENDSTAESQPMDPGRFSEIQAYIFKDSPHHGTFTTNDVVDSTILGEINRGEKTIYFVKEYRYRNLTTKKMRLYIIYSKIPVPDGDISKAAFIVMANNNLDIIPLDVPLLSEDTCN